MFAPKVPKSKANAAESPTDKLAPQRSTVVARTLDGQNGPNLATPVAAIYNQVGDSAKYICTGRHAQYHRNSG